MPYKQAGKIVIDEGKRQSDQIKFKHHGTAAAALLVFALILRFGIPILFAMGDDGTAQAVGMEVAVASLVGGICWIWGCIHLALHNRLHACWGLLGIFFILGIFALLWVARQKPAWDRKAAMRPARPKVYKGDPDSPY